jgi:hypothetical protein
MYFFQNNKVKIYTVQTSKCEGLLTSGGLTDKKENQIFLIYIYKEIQNGAAA